MWPIDQGTVSCDWLDFEPERVLDEYDGPMLFTCRSVTDELFLAFQCARNREAVRFLVVPTTEDLVRQLVVGEINLRDALTRSKMWVFDLNPQWQPVRCWRVNADQLPPTVLPEPGVMLYAHLQPVMNRQTIRSVSTETVFTRQFSGPPSATCAGVR